MINFLRRFLPASLMAIAGIVLLHNIDKPVNLELSPTSDASLPAEQPTPVESGNANDPGTIGTEPTVHPSVKPGKSSKPRPSSTPSTNSTPSSVPKPSLSALPGSTASTREVDGDAISNPYGLTQVRLVLNGSKIVDVQLLRAPGGESTSYTRFSVPRLRDAVLKSQSANVALVSGATYTSDSYLTSVQSALDKAGIK